MNIQAIVVANGFGIMLMVMLLFCIGKNIRYYDTAERFFFGMIWATIAQCAMEMASFLVDGQHFPGARILNYLLNAGTFSLNIVFVYLWTVYIRIKINEGSGTEHRSYWHMLPAGCVLLMVAANFFRPVVFSISADNIYSRTPFTMVPFLVSFYYLAYAEWMIYRSRSNTKRYLFLPSVIFLLPLLTGSILQMCLYGLSLTWPCLSISVVTIYINVQSMYTSVDSLSGVYTRQFLDGFLQHEVREPNEKLSGMMIDLDRFKEINDTCGHLAGDSAIREFGKLLRISAKSHDIVARYGGDEFIVIRKGEDLEGLHALSDELNQRMEELNQAGKHPYRLSASVGFSVYVPGQGSTDDFLKRMDLAMYHCKKKKSRGLPDRRGKIEKAGKI